ncbi:MAG TPA: branched-chain amino acid transaminase [Chloroflexota bacterium]|nr:branched-chain amino acid transaminase [Chloroflexota bacterium]
MSLPKSEKIWRNGKMLDWDAATIHVLSHVVHYGSALFEGARCYATPRGPAIFRLGDHIQRLLNSAKIYRIADVGFSRAQLEQACRDVVRVNKLPSAYLRPIVLRGYGSMGVLPTDNPIEVYIAAWEWGKYLGTDALTSGVDVCVSSWRRAAPDTMPAMAKAASNYMNSQLIKMEAHTNGFAEGIALDAAGLVSEGSGENIFLVKDGKLVTPPLSASVLPGITRDCVIRIAAEFNLEVVEQNIPREALYLADELFLCGTAAEITPVRSVDRIQVGRGGHGDVTSAIQKRFFALATGEAPDQYGWLSPVGETVSV